MASAVFLAPFMGSIILAVWLGTLVRPVHDRLSRGLHGHTHVAAVLTISILGIVLVPFAIVLVSLAIDAVALVRELGRSGQFADLLSRLAAPSEPQGMVELLRGDVGHVWVIVMSIAGVAVRFAIGLFIVIAGAYAVLVDGGRWYAWIEKHALVSRETFRRMSNAFVETGRGLLIGFLGAGLAQAILATVAFLVLGLSHALALGLLTLLAALIPAIGTALVWVPVTAGLAITGRTGAALGLALFGVLVIGTVDNLARPYLARRARLQLPTFVVLIAMFGGFEVMGAPGLLIAPLVLRLAKEGLAIYGEQANAASSEPAPEPAPPLTGVRSAGAHVEPQARAVG